MIPRIYDVTISLYGLEGRDLARLREVILVQVPANVDISISSDEQTFAQTEDPINISKIKSFEDVMRQITFSGGEKFDEDEITAIGSALLKNGLL